MLGELSQDWARWDEATDGGTDGWQDAEPLWDRQSGNERSAM